MDKQLEFTPSLPRNVILVDSSSTSRKLFSQNLEIYTGARVHLMANADEVIDKITRKDGIYYDLIISDNMVGDENTILKIFYTVNSKKLDIPIIVLGKNPKISHEVTEIDKEKWREVIKKSAQLMEVKSESMIEMEVPELYPFPLYVLLYDFKAPMNLYLSDKDKKEVWKRKDEPISKNEVRKLMLQGNKNIFVPNIQRIELTDFISERALSAIKESNLTLSDKVNATGRVFDITMGKLKDNGFDNKTLDLTKDLVESVVKITASTPGLEDFLEVIQESEESFLYKHSLLICSLAKGCLSHLEWGNKTQEKVLIYAAFFHDLALFEDELCEIHDLEGLKELNLGLEKLDQVEKHALKASELIQSYPQIPLGVDQVILQHHGSLNGLGLPTANKALDNRLSPLAIVFIVLEDFAHKFLKGEAKPKEIIRALEKKYAKGKERKVLEALNKVFS